MNLFEAIFLGLIQGATEFLPISSDGHLVLLPALFGLKPPDLNLISIAHQGTLLAILIYFRADIYQITFAVLDGLRWRQPLSTPESRLGWYIAVATLPAAIIGFLFKDFFEESLNHPTVAAFCLLLTAGLLVTGERLMSGRTSLSQMSWADALWVGLLQPLALLPGLSRSGTTIATAVWRGLDRPAAARFSFLLGIPAILGAGLLGFIDLLQAGNLADQAPAYFVTFLTSALVGYACIHFLLSWVRQHTLYPFAIYCTIFGLLYLMLVWLGIVS